MLPSTPSSHPSSVLDRLPVAAGLVLGLAFPSMMLGRAAFQIVLAVGLVALLAACWRRGLAPIGRSAFASVEARWALIVLASWVPSVIVSLDSLTSAGVLLRVAAILLAGALISGGLVRLPDARVWCYRGLVVGTVALVGFFVAGGFFYYEFVSALRSEGRPLFLGSVMKPSAALMVVAMPPLILAGWRLGRGWLAVAIAGALLSLVLMVQTGSRSAVVGLAAVVLVAAFGIAWRRRRALPVVLLALVMVAGTVFWLQNRPLLRMNDPDLSRNWAPIWVVDIHRQEIWRFTFERFLERPLFGHGLNVINEVEGAKNLIPGLIQAEYIPSHPHNWLVETLAEAGLFGFLPLLSAGVWLVIRSFRRAREDFVHLALASLVVGYGVASLASFSFWAIWWQLGFVTAYAILAADRQSTSSR